MGKRILEVKHTENISYPQARKLIENSVVSATYANVAKPVNNSTKNQEMIHYEMINLIKELKTLIELLRESLTNLISKPHTEPDPKKNLQLQINETEYQKNSNNNKPQASILSQPNPTIPLQKNWILMKAYC